MFNHPFALRLLGEFRPEVFERSVKSLIYRNEIFRRIFKKINGRWKTVPSDAINVKMAIEDLEDYS